MNAPNDLDRQLQAFLQDGPTDLPDPSFDAVRDHIEHTRQRAVIGPWRMPDIMNRSLMLGGSAIALVLVIIVGSQLFAPGGTGGAGAGGSPSPSPATTPAPSAAADGSLPVGSSYVIKDEDGVRASVIIPAPGWLGDGGLVTPAADEGPPAANGIITFTGELFVYGDPCSWSTTVPETPARTVDELVAALSAQAARDATDPVDITVDGYAGKSITLNVPDDAVFSACDQGYFGSWGGPDEPTPYRYHQAPGQIDELWILDVDGVLMVIDRAYYEETPAEQIAQMQAIVESLTFE